MKVEAEPDIAESHKIRVEVRCIYKDGKKYEAQWREVKGLGETVPEALRDLSKVIEAKCEMRKVIESKEE